MSASGHEVNGPSVEELETTPIVRSLGKRELARLAAHILQLKRRSRPTKPLIVEFCGSPKSGKSTAITALSTFLKRNGFRVKVLKEYAGECPIDDKTNWLFNVWTACSTVRRLIQYMAQRATDVDVILLDRGIFDALCWLRWLSTTRRIDDSSRESVTRFLLVHRFRAAIDCVFIFTVSPDESIRREYANLLTSTYGTIMNPVVLDEYLRAVRWSVGEFGASFKRIEEVDTTSTDVTEIGRDVTLRVLAILRESVMERIGYLSSRHLSRVFGDQAVVPLGEMERKGLSLDFEVRRLVEAEPRFVQPVAVAVLTNPARDTVAVLSKAPQSLGPSSPESARDLLYLGGHVRQDDAFEHSPEDLRGIIADALARELGEELGMNLPIADEQPFCVWDRQGPLRSRVHLAVVHVVEVDFDVFSPKMDRWEYLAVAGEKRIEPVPIDQVDRDRLESWSRVILDRVFGQGAQDALPFKSSRDPADT